MPDWVAKANIEHFKKLLETEKDPRKRAVIEKELAEEEAKLAALLKDRNEREERRSTAASASAGPECALGFLILSSHV